jgi:hypothetical protein
MNITYGVKDLTGYFDKTNIVNKNTYNKYLNETLDLIIDYLSQICGPTKLNAMFVVPDGGGKTTRIFSKDGINMLNAMEFYNPIQKDIVHAIRHIGLSIDQAAGDGSTTTMLFAALLLKNIINSENPEFKLSTLSIQEIKNKFTKQLALINFLLYDGLKITLDKLQNKFPDQINQIKHDLIYKQVIHSSHGNVKFAEVITELITQLPVTRLESITYTEARRTDSPELQIHIPEADYSSQVYCHTPFSNNTNFNTELVYQNCQIIIVKELGLDTVLDIVRYKKEEKIKDLPIIIISPHVDNIAVKEFFTQEFNYSNLSVFSFIGMGAENRGVSLQERTLLAINKNMSIINDGVSDIFIIPCEKVEFKYNKFMYFYGLLPETDTIEHYYYHNRDKNIYYNDFIETVETRLKDLKDSSVIMQQEIDWLEDVLDNLIIPKKPKLILGGDLTQRNSNKDAFHDAIKSVLPILTDGFYINVWYTIKDITQYLPLSPIIEMLSATIQELIDIINFPKISDLCLTSTDNIVNTINIFKDQDLNPDNSIRNELQRNYYNVVKNIILKDVPEKNILQSTLPIHASIMIDVLFNKILSVVMMGFVSYVIYQQAIFDEQKDT